MKLEGADLQRALGVFALIVVACVSASCGVPGRSVETSSAPQNPDQARLLGQNDFPPGYTTSPDNTDPAERARSQSDLVNGRVNNNAACAKLTADQVPLIAKSQRTGVVAVPKRPDDERYSETIIRNGQTLDDQRALAEVCRSTVSMIPGVGKTLERYTVVPAPLGIDADDLLVIQIDVTTDPSPSSGEAPRRRQTGVGFAQLGTVQVEFYQELDDFGSAPDGAEFNELFAKAVRRASDLQ